MTLNAPRSVEDYLAQLKAALAGQDPALIQDALYDAEEYLRAELAGRGEKSEADMLELIASTYGAPDEVAAAYVDTEAKVSAALRTPRPAAPQGAWRRFFGVFRDTRAYTGLFYMFLALATGIAYFTFAIVGVSLSAGLAILIIGIPLFLVFVGLSRVISLAECRLVEAVSGERMPRRPRHPGAATGLWQRIGDMLRDTRTWTTLAYFVLMLPLGIAYFTIAVTGLSLSLSLIAAPVVEIVRALGWIDPGSWLGSGGIGWNFDDNARQLRFGDSPALFVLAFVIGVLLVTALMHLARGIARMHAKFAKALLVLP
ncbi:MAG TPA: sensor domain-containing protein [Steroidobacteraceae bacterium]|nr:sensor domain-containing protein [Steroidobacteraceae bacterium]HRX90590.1 sensor domain-containing protein [Steroidobacteraceae bacterium]